MIQESNTNDGYTSSKFQLTKFPGPPGKCASCGYAKQGRDADRVYIDFGLTVEYYGAVLFCDVCLTEAANNIGWLNVDQHLELVNKLDQLTMRNTDLEAQNRDIRAAIRHLSDGGPAVGAVLESQELPQHTSGISGSNESGSKTERDISDNVTEQRPDDSSDNDSDTVRIE